MRKVLLLLLSFQLFFFFVSHAQAPCAFDKVHQNLLQSDAEYSRQVLQNNVSIEKYILEHPELLRPSSKKVNGAQRTLALYTIPVVVHVMHTGGAVGTIYNPTDAQITGAINYLNDVFAGTYAGMTAPVEGGGVVDMEIQFALAQRTPSCGATNGIDRVDATSLPNYVANGVNASTSAGCPDVTMKNLARWNTSDYYNIWLVNKIDGADGTSGQFIAGYAYFPGASSSVDGTVMLATQMQAGEKTLPHEIGHALNLYHPFEGSDNDTECPVNATCNTQGDRVCDTDPISQNFNVGTGLFNFTCRTGANSCATPNNYTVNTENNFMGYTNCFTLFTNGQKARVQAAMSLPSRASLVVGTNQALTPCGTTINFGVAAASRTEDITGTTVGCRTYRDYTYQMAIGAAPTATATATLTYGGTAIKGLDYDITTNGNFTSPSDVLTFTSGSTTSQNFTVRVYDDATVETGETVIIDFTVNNGGGDASKGTTTPTFTITLADNDVAPAGTGSGTFAVGTIAATITSAPFDARRQFQRGQYLYKATELTTAGMAAGNITAFDLFVQTKNSTRPFTNLTIRIAHTSVENLVDGSVNVIGGMTTVYTNASYATVSGWNSFTLSTPFAWNGTSNIAIEICYDNGTADAGNAADVMGVFFDGGSASQGNMFYQNNINCSGAFSSVSFFANGVKPIARFSTSVTGTAIETTATSTANNHIAVGSNDYIYSNNSRLLMRLAGLDAALGCVNTVLENAGTTWVSYAGGVRSAKVFAVTPTTNVSTTNYTIALYFTNAELGGNPAASLRIAKTTAASVAGANSSNTILVAPTVTTLGSGTTVFTASFTGFSRFFLVDAGVTLPVNLTNFSGRVTNEQNSLLNWETASELNNKQFDVELSRDGNNFTFIGSVAAKGNPTAAQQYEFVHLQPESGINYYRLKQIDIDGKFVYSKLISLNINNAVSKAFIYPVPASQTITINFGKTLNKGEVELFTADMKTIRKERITGSTIKKELNISTLSPGVYFIRLSGGESNEVLRFIKE